MPEFMNTSVMVDALGLALLHSLWQGLLIGILVKALMLAMNQASAQLRYWTSVGALALLAASVPLTTLYLLFGMQSLPLSTVVNSAAPYALTESARAGTGAQFGIPVIEWTVALWVAGVAIIATRTLISWRRLSGLHRAADIETASGLVHTVERLRTVFGLSGNVAIGLSASIDSPMIIGWLKPMILLPPAIAARLPREQLEMIIAHELAHLKRQDHWVNLFQVTTETLMFYHPVVTMVSRRIRIERENACDDLAVAATRKRLDYVEMLAALERERGPGPALALGVQDGQVLTRIRRLVEPGEAGKSRGAAIPALIALAAVAGLLAAPLIEETAGEGQAPVAVSSLYSADEPGSRPSERVHPTEAVAGEIAPEAHVQDQPDLIESQSIATPQIELPEISEPPAVRPTPSSSSTRADDTATPAAPEPTSPVSVQRDQSLSAPSAPEPSAPALVEQAPLADESPDMIDGILDIELLQSDPATLLANRTEIPVPLPEDSPVVAAEAEPLNGDAKRASQVILAGGDLLREIQPSYPRGALRRDISGNVEVELEIDTSGRVADVSILSEKPADAGFGDAAREAARNWRFKPFTVDGEPTAQRKTVEFDFEPGDGCRMVTGTRLPRC